MPTKVAIHGAAGRMGQRVIALGRRDPNFEIVAALESADHHSIGSDAGLLAGVGDSGVLVESVLGRGADVLIDFSVPVASVAILEECRRLSLPMVCATTGFNESQHAQVEAASAEIPICWAPNMSLAVNLVMKLSEIAATALADHPSGADVEIIERHHRFKEDAPSGTALALGRVIADAMGQTHHQHGRAGRPGARPHEEIGYHALRTGDNPGEHTIVFGLLGETVELRVAATSRDCYAQGALVAATWLVGKPAGRYGMKDVLGL